MDKTNKIFIVIIIVCLTLTLILCGYAILHHQPVEDSDAKKFELEYENINGNDNGSGSTYMELDIPEDNPIIYKTSKEILEVLEQESAIVYFGFAECPWCRNMINTLIEVACDKKIDKIYYVDIQDIRDTYEYNGSIQPELVKSGTKGYYDILDFFGDKLSLFYISDEEGNLYSTGVTRLYAPTVVAVKDGEIMDMHVATVDSQTDPAEPLDEEQKSELYDIYDKLMDSLNETCSTPAC